MFLKALVFEQLHARLLSTISHRSLPMVKPYEPQLSEGTNPGSRRNNGLPKEYELMMQKVFHRIGFTVPGRRRIYSIVLSRRASKCSEEARLSTPEGRLTMYRRLIEGRRSLWNHDW
ncbi:unnamed protein product [Dicrocoelium dendriticum]|nr:unnamed protein product [Dicrocoelium dendriticum]